MRSSNYITALEHYLKERHYRNGTIRDKKTYIRRFLDWLESEALEVEQCSYSDLLNFIRELKKQQRSTENTNKHLIAVRQLYESQMSLEHLNYNPAANLYIKGHIQRLPHDLLNQKQLIKIYNSLQPKTPVQYRDKMIFGMYINQGLIRKEIDRLTVEDPDLEKGILRIRKNIKLNERILPLASYQVMSLHKYLQEIRPQLLKQSKGEKGKRLFFTLANNESMNDCLKFFLRALKKQHPELKSFHQIRSSVISKWIKEKPIREVQYMAGHNSITSTERYRQIDLQDLQESLNRFHPMK